MGVGSVPPETFSRVVVPRAIGGALLLAALGWLLACGFAHAERGEFWIIDRAHHHHAVSRDAVRRQSRRPASLPDLPL